MASLALVCSASKVPTPEVQEDYLPATVPPTGTGRVPLPFNEAAAGTQRNRSAALAKEKCVDELVMATQKRAIMDKEEDLAWVMRKIKVARLDNRCTLVF